MAVSLKHKFQSAKAAGTDNTLVQPTNWNDEHNLLMDVDNLLGRATAGNGAVEQIPCASFSRSMLAQSTQSGWLTALAALPSAGGTISGNLVVGGGLTGVAGHFTGVFQVDSTTQLTGAVNLSSGLTVSGGTSLQGVSGTGASFTSMSCSGAGSFGGTLTVTGALAANGGVTAPNCAKLFVRFAGGSVGQQFGLGSATFVSTGSYNVSQPTAAGTGVVQVTPETTTPTIATYQWLDSQTFNVRFYNTSGALVDPFGWSALLFR